MNTLSITRLASAALLLAFLCAPTQATTFVETVRAAVERHPDYPLVEARRKIAAGYRQQAGSLLGGDPSVDLSATQASLRSRERFWDIRVPKIDSIFDNSLVPRPSWSPGVPPQHRKLVAATHRSPI